MGRYAAPTFKAHLVLKEYGDSKEPFTASRDDLDTPSLVSSFKRNRFCRVYSV